MKIDQPNLSLGYSREDVRQIAKEVSSTYFEKFNKKTKKENLQQASDLQQQIKRPRGRQRTKQLKIEKQ